ncbi:MAG: hypothetical protein WCX48_12050 [Bacteroidales bacterium]
MKKLFVFVLLFVFASCGKFEDSNKPVLKSANVKTFKMNNVFVSVVPIVTKSEDNEMYEVCFNSDNGQLETILTISETQEGGSTQVFYLMGTNEEIITVITDSEDNIISVEPPQGSNPEYIASDSFIGALKYYRNCVAGKWRTLSSYLSDNPELGVVAMAGGHYVAGVFVITSTADCLREML